MESLRSPEDVLSAIDDGVVELTEGIQINSVDEGGAAYDIGFRAEDKIILKDGKVINSYMAVDMGPGEYQVLRDGKMLTYEVLEDYELGMTFYNYFSFPRIKVFDLDKESNSYKAGLRTGDYVINVNGHQVYSVQEYEGFIRGEEMLEYEVYRNGVTENVIVELDQNKQVVISEVIPDGPADVAKFKDGDVIVEVNGNKISNIDEIIPFLNGESNEKLAILIERDRESLFFEVDPEEGKIGVLLSELITYGGESGLSVYNVNILSSVTEINEIKYPFYKALYKSFEECVRLGKMTGEMFVGFVVGFVSDGEVPETVAGPVGIAQLTHMFVQEGLIPVLRFVALLSLTLAVINILPFPALDGGRLLFMLIEFVIGRRVNQKWESYIHAFGYALIILLIFAVTYNDIARLLNS